MCVCVCVPDPGEEGADVVEGVDEVQATEEEGMEGACVCVCVCVCICVCVCVGGWV
jgi:hypothetical protein